MAGDYEPVNLAILIQDDLVGHLSNEMKLTGYLTSLMSTTSVVCLPRDKASHFPSRDQAKA